MPDPEQSRLAEAVSTIHSRFGSKALYRLGRVVARRAPAEEGAALAGAPFLPPRLPTGFATLDEALGGGLPRGRLVELGGTPTAGTVTLALKIVACAQSQRYTALYLDLGQTFDPVYADRCGVALNQLLLLHPRNRTQALALLRDLLLSESGSIVVLDFPAPLPSEGIGALSNTLDRLLAPLARSDNLLLCLNARPPAQAAPQATVRLWLERERWLYHQHDIRGYRAQVQILKNKGGPSGQQVPVAFTYAGLP